MYRHLTKLCIDHTIQQAEEEFMRNPMPIRCVVAGVNANGVPDFYPVEVTCTPDQYGDGDHYKEAEEAAREADYCGKMVVFDEKDGPAWLFAQFNWETARKV